MIVWSEPIDYARKVETIDRILIIRRTLRENAINDDRCSQCGADEHTGCYCAIARDPRRI